jgi:hypothetical protein
LQPEQAPVLALLPLVQEQEQALQQEQEQALEPWAVIQGPWLVR